MQYGRIVVKMEIGATDVVLCVIDNGIGMTPEVHDPLHALAVAARGSFDAFLLDIGLPGMDGIELARRLRLLPQGESALLIAITGYGSPQDREAALDAGFDYHFVKPAPLEKLLAIFARTAPRLQA